MNATGTHVLDNTSVTTYKNSFKPISDALKTVLTQTADTGQVNWTNVTTAPGGQSIRDYEVYKFSDPLQATAPIYIRFDYVFYLALRILVTVGTGTDGAGGITGVTTGALDGYSLFTGVSTTNPGVGATAANNGSTTSVNFYVSSDGSYLTLLYGAVPSGLGSATSTAAWIIDRTRNADGTGNSNGFAVWNISGGNFQGGVYRYTNGNAQPTGWDFNVYSIVPVPTQLTAFTGNTSYCYPIHANSPVVEGASQAMLFGINTDWPRLSQVTIPHYGNATATWMPLGTSGTLNLPYKTSGSATSTNAAFSPIVRF